MLFPPPARPRRSKYARLPVSVPAAYNVPLNVSVGTARGPRTSSRGAGWPVIIRSISVARSMRAESAQWAEVIKAAGVKLQ